MMSAFEAFETYFSIKLHFTSAKYDYHKYNGKLVHSVKRWENSRHKFFFEKIARQYSLPLFVDYMVANEIHKPIAWIGEINDPQFAHNYLEWLRKIESLTYLFTEDCDRITREASTAAEFNQLFNSVDKAYPRLLQRFYHREVMLETLLIFNRLFNFLPLWEQQLSDDVICRKTFFKWKKYDPFLRVSDINILRGILKGKLT